MEPPVELAVIQGSIDFFNAVSSAAQKIFFPHRLIQLAIDGYNVCIFAYGQTGSGKTFTMVGDKEQKNPGIIPRSFNGIFDIIRENSTKFNFKVTDSISSM